MSGQSTGIEDQTLQCGLLMESAQAHQRVADEHLQRLQAHTRDLDAVVRDAIARTLVEELQALTAECSRAEAALQAMTRTADRRRLVWHMMVVALCSVIPAMTLHLGLPTAAEITALRSRRDTLEQNLQQLERRGAKAEWRSCGESARLCVRVDRLARAYGDQADYLIVRGY